jgi:hypothetical protein
MQTLTGRWFGAGSSVDPDAVQAGAEATAAALAGRTAGAVFVFAAHSYDLSALLAAVRNEAGPDVPIVGATTLGELSTDGATSDGVAVAAMGGSGFTVRTRMARIDELGHRAAGAAVAAAMTEVHKPYKAMMLLSDGLSGNPHEIVRGAYSVIGAAIPLVGGMAGDPAFQQTKQLYGEEVLTCTVIGVAIGSDAPLGIGVAHGWQRVEPPMVITRSSGVRIYEIDGEPALEVLQRRRGMTDRTAEQFFREVPIMQALGLSRKNGEDIRVLHAGDDAEGWVEGAQDMPQGALCWLMDGDYESLITGAKQSCAEALDGLSGHPPLGLFTFDCGGRRGALGDHGVTEELTRMRDELGPDVPFAGFYTMGEIARVRGSIGTHALTLVTLAMA